MIIDFMSDRIAIDSTLQAVAVAGINILTYDSFRLRTGEGHLLDHLRCGAQVILHQRIGELEVIRTRIKARSPPIVRKATGRVSHGGLDAQQVAQRIPVLYAIEPLSSVSGQVRRPSFPAEVRPSVINDLMAAISVLMGGAWPRRAASRSCRGNTHMPPEALVLVTDVADSGRRTPCPVACLDHGTGCSRSGQIGSIHLHWTRY